MERKEYRLFYISVEGDTEEWYLDWLQSQINNSDDFAYRAKIISKVQKDPVSYVKSYTFFTKSDVWHWFDYESAEPVHAENFKRTMDRMRQAEEIKPVCYKFGYSNFTFDLWIILHKKDCFGSLTDRKQYIHKINKAFGENFADMVDYKHKDHFNSLLKKCTLDDVMTAIDRGKKIQKRNQEAGYKLQEYRGFNYYDENPSLMIWQTIENILVECGYKKL